ncbi:hypothetical protein O7626_40755 [Micromonospora sp. WMMD1102]|uniref:hypothetical protein n=1 Tax=Micromonospora sp. WMMD1102 TaxID=3016105 RepID=UPI002415932D|nr:hypothetical protein [Micromonospora sp. WMMD1102]MDG4790381.1 hypothetical protein [Micromonospora sp. WMMD1102]MDG4792135.1 hypothetical protein [Micromonospora sp. WMMD1102]
MSGELRVLTFGATTRDIDHWPADQLAAAEASGADSYHDWIFNQLEEAMHKAGQEFIDQHPDIFACELG